MQGEEQPIADTDDAATVAASPESRRRTDDEVPTVALPPSRRAPQGTPGRPAPGPAPRLEQVALAHATRLLDIDDAMRLMAFCRVVASLTGIGVVLLPFFYNPARPLYWPMAATLVLLFGLSSFMWWHIRGGNRPLRAVQRAFNVVCFLSGMLVIYDLGLFSPAPLLYMLGITWQIQGNDRPFSVGGTVLAIAGYVVLALLVVAGVIPDLGLMASTAPPSVRLIFVVLVPAACGVAAWQGMQIRSVTLAAIEKEHEALRAALTRDAQLAEAHHNLEVALKAGAGGSGRHSGKQMGRYRLAEMIGRGAMGEVYAAADVETGAPAAVKVLQAAASSDPDLVARFLREGRITARLQAPNVVTVFELGTAERAPFIAMELLVGEDLSSQLRRQPRLGLGATVELCDQVARGLSAAHRAGVVHRDLKPQNIFSARQRGGPAIWKILDFGVSKLLDGNGTLTNAAVVGTPGYMSPEQAQGREADYRSDVFSLGAVAYRALTGRPPFSGELPQILDDISRKSPLRPSALFPDLPLDIDRVLAIALAKRAEDRFDGALELASALRDASRGALAPALRARADAIVAQTPWSTPMQAA